MRIVVRWSWLFLLAIALWGCNLPQATPAPSPQVPLTVAALFTQTAVAGGGAAAPSATFAPQPTTPPPPSPLPTATATPLPTPTPTPSVPMVSVTVNTNCRTGPGKPYPKVGALLVGQAARVVGRDPSGGYLYIENPSHSGAFCWIWAQYARVSGPHVNLPVFTPIPLPPDATVAFVGATQCMDGVHVAFKVTNTGGLTWESYVADYEDLTHPDGFTSFQTFKFYDDPGCVDASHEVIDDLETGEYGYIQFALTGSLIAPGDRVRLTVRLISVDGPGGQEITRKVEFTFPTP